eukprot:TRINITY_DN19416_c0_g1_i1.p1 TRINITY_DN19416_c0_g1~~TRINITY_DN19416_c0_g1_i1.p1  ORF type:complete len:504 (-),score=132.36 TRINITY_DN19416_c0_g1_i1:39-1550(-)
MLKEVIYAAILTIVLLVGTVLFNTITVVDHQLPHHPLSSEEVIYQTEEDVCKRMAASLRFTTISYSNASNNDYNQFLLLHQFLESAFPRVHTTLKKEIVNKYSLLYTWEGSNPSLRPIMLASHMDVVPIEVGTEDLWTYPPFAGVMKDGYVWGRGTMDDRLGLLGILEAIEDLLSKNYKPSHTILLAFGHDEEVSGFNGAGHIAKLLQSRNVKAELILDEGLMIARGIIGGIDKPIALLGVAEKGFATLKLTVKTSGGHSSMPPLEPSSIGIIADAIVKLEKNPFPSNLKSILPTLTYLASKMPFVQKMAISNMWLFGSIIEKQLLQKPSTAATTRTTTAVTIVTGGVKENVIPMFASAITNHRISITDTVKSVVERVRSVIGDTRVNVDVLTDGDEHVTHSLEPSPETRLDSEGFKKIHFTISQVFPEALVAPSVMIANTDCRHYLNISDTIIRFLPNVLDEADLKRFHGIDERIEMRVYHRVIQFYASFIRNADRIGVDDK